MSGDGPKAPYASPDPPGRDDWRTTFRPDIPSSVRIYDYFLGGKDHFQADRDAADQIAAYLPNMREAARINRAFVRRAVRYLVSEAGIRQPIDIGAGLPTMGNVHEVATAAHPAAPGSYVALTHGTADAAPRARDAARVYDAATTRMFVRSRAEVLALARGLDAVEPGLVWTPEWHPEPGEQVPARPSDCYYYALVARKP